MWRRTTTRMTIPGALTTAFRRKFASACGPASLLPAYTWSHALTDMPSQSTASGNVLNYTTIRNLGLDKAPLSNDRRHAFRLYGTYDLPLGRGRRWPIANPVLERIAGGWTLGGIATWFPVRPALLAPAAAPSTILGMAACCSAVCQNLSSATCCWKIHVTIQPADAPSCGLIPRS